MLERAVCGMAIVRDTPCNCFLIDAFMLQRDGPAPGACSQQGPLRTRR